MTAEKLTLKFANAGLGFTSLVAKNSLDEKTPHSFLVTMKEQLIRDAPESAPRIFGAELTRGLATYFDLPYGQTLSVEQLVKEIAEGNRDVISIRAGLALSEGHAEEFLFGIIEKLKDNPFTAHTFLGDVLTFKLNTFIIQQKEQALKWTGHNAGGLIRFTRDGYTAVFSASTGTTKVYLKEELIDTHVMDRTDKPLREYLEEINQIVINKHK